MLKSDRLVCEKNATVAQSVTNYNLDPSILIMKQIYQSFMWNFTTTHESCVQEAGHPLATTEVYTVKAYIQQAHLVDPDIWLACKGK